MLQVARLARKVLGESAELTRKFVLTQINEDGAFKDRTGKSDLYYTVFGLESLIALEVQHAGSDAQSPELIEVINARPLIWPNCLSSGVVTDEAITSGPAPGY